MTMSEDLKSRLLQIDHGDGGSQWFRNPDGAEAWAEIERLRDQLDYIEREGTAEINAAVDLRSELAKARAEMQRLWEALQSAVTHIENDAESIAIAFGVSDWTRVAPQSAKIVDQARAALKGGDDA